MPQGRNLGLRHDGIQAHFTMRALGPAALGAGSGHGGINDLHVRKHLNGVGLLFTACAILLLNAVLKQVGSLITTHSPNSCTCSG